MLICFHCNELIETNEPQIIILAKNLQPESDKVYDIPTLYFHTRCFITIAGKRYVPKLSETPTAVFESGATTMVGGTTSGRCGACGEELVIRPAPDGVPDLYCLKCRKFIYYQMGLVNKAL